MLDVIEIDSRYYYPLTEKILNKIEEIKPLANELDFEYSAVELDDNCFYYLDFEYGKIIDKGECDYLQIKFKLKINSLYKFDFKYNYEDVLMKRLEEFELFLNKAKENPNILDDYKILWNDNYDFPNIEGYREQIKKYDYEFYI